MCECIGIFAKIYKKQQREAKVYICISKASRIDDPLTESKWLN